MWHFKKAQDLIDKGGRLKKWIAEQTGISNESLTQYIQGRRNPPDAWIKKFARLMGGKFTELREGPDAPRQPRSR